MYRDALVLALGTQTQVELPVPGDPSETSVTIGDFVVETGTSEGILFLRITPLKEIQCRILRSGVPFWKNWIRLPTP